MGKSKVKPCETYQKSLRFVLDVFSYAYYVKASPLIEDTKFDALEKVYLKFSGQDCYEMRGQELDESYHPFVKEVFTQFGRINELEELLSRSKK